MTPMEVFEAMREKGILMLQTAFMESGQPMPERDSREFQELLMPVLAIGIAAATEYLAANPEHLAIAGSPICSTCREEIKTLQVGADIGVDPESTVIQKVAWPCGHIQ